jgi:cytidine deaminase
MCAEDAAVSDLQKKLGDNIELHRSNVNISHTYVRKYSKKGRLVNRISPCTHCRNNYGSALNDTTEGSSDLTKDGRRYLPPADQ